MALAPVLTAPPTTIESLWATHNRAIDLLAQGKTPAAVALELGVPEVAINAIAESPIVRQRLEQMADPAKQLKGLVPKAIRELTNILDSRDPTIRPDTKLRAVDTVLDRTGYSKETIVSVEHFTPAEIAEIKASARRPTITVEAIPV